MRNGGRDEGRQSVCVFEEPEVLSEATLTFEENLIVANCDDYGCTCISHEKCCGCFVQ